MMDRVGVEIDLFLLENQTVEIHACMHELVVYPLLVESTKERSIIRS
jgi:hypothetical protein